jgi:hypothetical protein
MGTVRARETVKVDLEAPIGWFGNPQVPQAGLGCAVV